MYAVTPTYVESPQRHTPANDSRDQAFVDIYPKAFHLAFRVASQQLRDNAYDARSAEDQDAQRGPQRHQASGGGLTHSGRKTS